MPVINTNIAETTTITENGTYDVARYTTANVNVTFTPTSYRAFQIDNESGKLVNSTTNPWVPLPDRALDLESYCFYKAYQGTPANILSGVIDLSSLTEISGTGACQYMFKDCPGIIGVNLSSLAVVSGANACQSMFENCTSLTSINLSSLYSCNSKNKSIFDAMFKNCTNLQGSLDLSSLTVANGQYCFKEMFALCSGITSVDLSNLTTIGTTSYVCQYMFQNCTSLMSVDLSSLTTVSGYGCFHTFEGCSNLTNVNLASLSKLNGTLTLGSAFANCIKLKSLSFPALQTVSSTSSMDDMLLNIYDCTIHFPSNMQSVIRSQHFGGNNTVVLFDLPATNLLTGEDGINYSRNPKYDTQTALAWKIGAYGVTNFVPVFYTNGVTDPQVGDTIYSDSACTIAVTMINSIS